MVPGKRPALLKGLSGGHGRQTITVVTSDNFDAEPLLINVWIGSPKPLTCLSSSLLDTGCTGNSFIHQRLIRGLCQKYDVAPFKLTRPKPLVGFDGRESRPVREAIVLPLQIRDHLQQSAVLYIADIGHHDLIIGKP